MYVIKAQDKKPESNENSFENSEDTNISRDKGLLFLFVQPLEESFGWYHDFKCKYSNIVSNTNTFI